MMHTGEKVTAYRIGRRGTICGINPGALRGLIKGRDPSNRPARRWFYVKLIATDLNRLQYQLPHRPWQAEFPGCRYAYRGMTRASVERRANADWMHLLVHGEHAARQVRMQKRWRPLKHWQAARRDRWMQRRAGRISE